MKPHLFAALLLTGAVASPAFAADDAADNTGDRTSANTSTAEAMEHVEVTGYPLPQAAAQELLAEREQLVQQMREQHRRELLRSVLEAQLQQLEAFRLEGERDARESLAQELPREQLQQVEPAALTTDPDAAEPTEETRSGESESAETGELEPS
ncbi:hypothetical protein [uncultured Microbulbifer sp.]|uniref:hypothetical protein n=1 Tax=uncultured Microbulbifer sp. TaxID=348147 RepID=UPI0025DC1BF0|nr:hypothetical protein [uncultured Microbulbifer sp.]